MLGKPDRGGQMIPGVLNHIKDADCSEASQDATWLFERYTSP